MTWPESNKPLDRIFIEITNVCNLSCSFCKPSARPALFMKPDLFAQIIAQGRHLAREVVLHVLGEPLLHPDLEPFIDIAHDAGLSVMITTNGTLLNREAGAMLARKGIRKINISLHAAPEGEALHEYCRGLFAFIDQARSFSPRTLIQLRLWNAFSEASRRSVELINAHYGSSINCPNQLSECGPRRKKYLGNNLSLHFDPLFTWPSLQAPLLDDHGFCHGLASHIGILSDGTVVPCCLDAEGILALGSITQTPLAELLSGEGARSIRSGFDTGILREELCRRCGFITRFKKRQGSGKKRQDQSRHRVCAEQIPGIDQRKPAGSTFGIDQMQQGGDHETDRDQSGDEQRPQQASGLEPSQ